MSDLFWLSDEQWGRIQPLLPVYKRGFRRVDDRHVINSKALRAWLRSRGTEPVIPPRKCHKRPPAFDRSKYRARNVVERTFCRLKDFRRIATRYDKLAKTFLAALCIVASVIWWIN